MPINSQANLRLNGYGVTPTGFVKKRLDVILDEIHGDISAGWGINTRLNPKSFLNVLLTNASDKWAELWEVAEQNYFAMYPFSAENISLDHAVEFGGITREDERPTYYPINCECVDGTVISKNTKIKSNTNPAVEFICTADTLITRNRFISVKIKVAAVQANYLYSIAIDGSVYSYTSSDIPNTDEILNGLFAAVISDKVSTSFTDGLLEIRTLNQRLPCNLTLSGNLTTESVTAIINFASEETGEIILPDGTITEIMTNIPGLIAVNNLNGYIAGRVKESDVKLRQSYMDKIFSRSLTMVESIKSAILLNCQGITAIEGYENDTDFTDTFGRPPHSIEIVADGGDNIQIAQHIFTKKAAGIQTYGDVNIDMLGNNGETIPIYFNRPSYLYIWFKVVVTLKQNMGLPSGYIDIIKDSIINQTKSLGIAKDLVSQEFLKDIYTKIPGIAYIDIPMFYTHDITEQAGDYAYYSCFH